VKPQRSAIIALNVIARALARQFFVSLAELNVASQ
jgi:hypothetical protein